MVDETSKERKLVNIDRYDTNEKVDEEEQKDLHRLKTLRQFSEKANFYIWEK